MNDRESERERESAKTKTNSTSIILIGCSLKKILKHVSSVCFVFALGNPIYALHQRKRSFKPERCNMCVCVCALFKRMFEVFVDNKIACKANA